MKKPLLKTSLSLIILLAFYNTANAQNLNWVKQLGFLYNDNAYAIVLDDSANVYTTGTFEGTVDFDPGPGIYNITAMATTDAFVSKLDSAGNFIWAFQLGGTSQADCRAMTLDSIGNIYITGIFADTADFDPGPGVFNLVSIGYRDIFILKLNPVGNFIWARNIGGSGVNNYTSSIAVDVFGNVYTTGEFNDTADFDPGPAVYSLGAQGVFDIFISKLDAAGNFVYVKQFGALGYDYGYDITTDASGNVYTTGTYFYTVDFDPGANIYNLTSAGNADIFISKMDSGGNFIWAKSMGGLSNDYSRAIAVDASGNVYTTGSFSSIADFDPGAATFNLTQVSNAGDDLFVSKLNSSGNFVWAKAMGGTGAGYGASIAVDVAGNVYTTGYFDGTTDFNPGTGVFDLTSVWFTGGDVYVSKLNPAGNFAWAAKMGGSSYDYGRSIAIDASGNVYTTGSFTGTADFDPGAATFNLSALGFLDIFICKLGSMSTPTTEINLTSNIKFYPNPTSGKLTIELKRNFDNTQVILKNILGHELLAKKYCSVKRIDLDLDQEPGIYFIELTIDSERPLIQKIIKK